MEKMSPVYSLSVFGAGFRIGQNWIVKTNPCLVNLFLMTWGFVFPSGATFLLDLMIIFVT